ncbi:MAG TPA: hypothetical protein VHV10_05950 [Ktedonobacteraceae bacterium]|jgi:hypothetical protein|nr:hypothetical protein [Ktedonobacteraceae bacterium]
MGQVRLQKATEATEATEEVWVTTVVLQMTHQLAFSLATWAEAGAGQGSYGGGACLAFHHSTVPFGVAKQNRSVDCTVDGHQAPAQGL